MVKTRGFPPPGGATDHGETPSTTSKRELVLPTAGGRNANGEDGGTGDLHFQEAEYGGPVNFYSDHSGPLPGVGEAPGVTGDETVVGAGGAESCGCTGGRGGRRDGRGGRIRQGSR